MFARALPVIASICAVVLPAAAQDPDPVDQRVLEMRRSMEDGRNVVRSHVRVHIRLRNGNRLQGVVKDGTLIERVDGLRFVAAEKEEAGAGIRLYYWNGKNSFVFVPFADMREYKVKERLTSEQLAEIEREVSERAEQERLAAERAQKAKAEQGRTPEQKPAEGKEGTGDGKEPPSGQQGRPAEGKPAEGRPAEQQGQTGIGLSPEQQRLFALLQEYPPSAGWSEARRDEIARRRAVVGANPSESEQRFVQVFADWQRACTIFGVPAAEPPKPTEEPRDRRNKR